MKKEQVKEKLDIVKIFNEALRWHCGEIEFSNIKKQIGCSHNQVYKPYMSDVKSAAEFIPNDKDTKVVMEYYTVYVDLDNDNLFKHFLNILNDEFPLKEYLYAYHDDYTDSFEQFGISYIKFKLGSVKVPYGKWDQIDTKHSY